MDLQDGAPSVTYGGNSSQSNEATLVENQGCSQSSEATPHWSKIKVQFLGQQRNGIPVVAYIDFSHLKTELSILPDLQSE